MFSIDGLVSGLDTTSIIEGLVSLQASQVDRLNLRKNEILTQQTAFQGIEVRALSLRSTMTQLTRGTSSVFETSAAFTSDESIMTATAGNNAAEGTYAVRVNSLAKAHQIGSQGFDSNSTSITQGTIDFKVGDRDTTSITIDASNNTVTGLVSAINSQSDDVSASIIHDQANNADRILLTSKHTGESNQIVVTNNLGTESGDINVAPLNNGVAVDDNATGVGYLMYSAQSVHTRFSVHSANADHIVAVRNLGGQWQYNTNDEWLDFTPDSSDVLLASVDFTNDTVTDLAGSSSIENGITRGYDSGDLVFTANQWNGESNAGEFGITGTYFDPSGETVRPDFTGLAIQEATNASIQLGSGPGAITAEYDTNSVEGLIENVTLNLVTADATKDITINVARDTEAAVSSIQDFVDEYNSLISYIDDQTRFNTETNVASPLVGNRNVSTLKSRLSAMVTETVPGLDSSLNRFSQIGIEIGATGKLSVNSAKLNEALNGELEGVDSRDIKRLFALGGESSNSNIEFLLGSTRTVASSSAYEVDILQAAERGAVTATSDLASSIVIDGTNNAFQLSLDGQESDVLTLAAGTYTRQEMADHIESLINASSSLPGREVNVSLEGDALEITSQGYGQSSKVSGISGSAITVLGFDGSETGQGKDVAGSFIVNGVVETATGSGRVLVGDSDNENTADLQVRVTLDPSQVGTGAEGEIQISRGVASRLDQYFGDLLDPDTGTIKTANEDFDLRIESLEASIGRVNAISEAKTQYLIEQFAALERVLSELQSTSSFLTNQLASL